VSIVDARSDEVCYRAITGNVKNLTSSILDKIFKSECLGGTLFWGGRRGPHGGSLAVRVELVEHRALLCEEAVFVECGAFSGEGIVFISIFNLKFGIVVIAISECYLIVVLGNMASFH